MSNKRSALPVCLLFAALSVAFVRCGNSETGQNMSDSTLNKPAPDNTSATNPSLADSAYHKDSTGKIPDTSRSK